MAATRVRCRRPTSADWLYETVQPDEIAALAEALRTSPGSGAHCMCAGTLLFEFDGSPSITLHHGETVRRSGSFGNEPLVSPDAVMDWLSARGITFVREEYEADRVREAEGMLEEARWQAALPASLAPFFHEMRGFTTSAPEWTAAVEAEFPDPVDRARAMLELYGSGVGRWSGYPSWETVPQQMLLELPFDVLFAALGDAPSERCCEGAIRLFCSWDFRKRKKQLRAKLPEAIRERLLVHAQTLPDDNIETAMDFLR